MGFAWENSNRGRFNLASRLIVKAAYGANFEGQHPSMRAGLRFSKTPEKLTLVASAFALHLPSLSLSLSRSLSPPSSLRSPALLEALAPILPR